MLTDHHVELSESAVPLDLGKLGQSSNNNLNGGAGVGAHGHSRE